MLMLASNNILSATGGCCDPSQIWFWDLIIDCIATNHKNQCNKTLCLLEDVIFAFEDRRLSLHEWIWVRFNGEVEDEDEMRNPQKTQELEDGSRLEMWNLRRDRFDSQNNLISRFILTTVGRVVMNYTIIDSVSKT